MIFFGHIGVSVAVAASLRKDIDLRKVAFFSVAPDLLDKSLSLCSSGCFDNTDRLYGHSLVVSCLGLALAYLFCKRIPNSPIYGLAYLGHLPLDRMWLWMNPVTLLWPALGPLYGATSYPELVLVRSGFDAYNLMGEILGLALLTWTLTARVRNPIRLGGPRKSVRLADAMSQSATIQT